MPLQFLPSTRHGLSADVTQKDGISGGVKKSTLGICCMRSKVDAPPMQAILHRLGRCGDFDIIVFPQETILEKPIEEWPVVECFLAFFSTGFPLEKCIAYTKLVNPTVINEVEAQTVFRSRVTVYKTLEQWCIPCPDHVIVDHLALAAGDGPELVENENYIIHKGKKISKPFVEKPEDGDRHDIWIYYPRSIGGGAKKLFRKVKDKSSEFDANQNQIRRDGVYIYEPFLPTQGTDIKVYTVGAGYHHAEARKAPTVDGKVQRSKDGKEVRYPVVLTQAEKAICAFIVKAFRQNICGFDILRTDGGSYVCDVNGWSFVKGNQKYYNDCSTLIRKHLLDERGVTNVDTSTMMILGPGDEVIRDTFAQLTPYESLRESAVSHSKERLRCVLVVMRHGDRRPKEKMKFKSKHPLLLAYLDKLEEDMATEVKLKTPEEMQALKVQCEAVAKDLEKQLKDAEASQLEPPPDYDAKKVEERISELKRDLLNIELLIPVLDMKDRFAGLERKVQLKASKWKPQKDPDAPRKVAQMEVVAKWGGELTKSGLAESEDLGRQLRLDLYPNDPTGLLRLHSSFRHDFKIYSSQEGRCQITASAFTKGFLDLEGDITPILVSLVTRDSYAQAFLDEPIPKKLRDEVKQKIESLLMSSADMSSAEIMPLSCPTEHTGLRDAASRIGSPLALLHKIRRIALTYIDSIAAAKERAFRELSVEGDSTDYGSYAVQHSDEDQAQEDVVPLGKTVMSPESVVTIPLELKDSRKRQWLHLKRKEHRWRKLYNGFAQLKDESGAYEDSNVTYDCSKIPDVWDNLWYDILQHRNILGEESCQIAEKMVGLIHPLNEWVCLSEYGISCEEKLKIGVDVTWRLIGKILGDLEFMIDDDIGNLDAAGKLISETHDGAQIGAASKDHGDLPDISWKRSVSGQHGATNEDVPPLQAPKPLRPGESSTNSASPPDSPPGISGNSTALDEDRSASPSGRMFAVMEDTKVPSAGGAGGKLAPKVGSHCSLASSADPGSPSARKWREWSTQSPRTNPTGSKPSSPPEGQTPGDLPATASVSFAPTKPPARASSANSMAEDENQLQPPLMVRTDSSHTSPASAESVAAKERRRSKLSKLTPEVRNELKHALRDSSDWHPRLNEEVAKLTDIKNTRIVRSRIYVTSASTMHSLFNILRHGQHASGDESSIVSDLGEVIDLSYLTHIVFRCYEREAPAEISIDAGMVHESPEAAAEHLKNLEKARYRVEISMSPGKQVFQDGQMVQWPDGSALREVSQRVKVDNSKLFSEESGLRYRKFKNISDVAEERVEPWGTIVDGSDEGDGWFRVGDLFLPFFEEGHRVLIKEARGNKAVGCAVAPLKIIADSVELSRIERFLTEVVKEYGSQNAEEDDEDEN